MPTWVESIGGKRLPLTEQDAQSAMEAYFLGTPPLTQPKDRKDIPDSFIFQNIHQLATKDVPLSVIHPALERISKVSIVEDCATASELYSDAKTVKLFFKEHYLYPCYSQTWGASKGQDHYQDVCVVLNATSWKKYGNKDLSDLAALSRNKLYVACSRARGDLYLMPESLLKTFKMKPLEHHPTPA